MPIYEMRVQGCLDQRWSTWFDGLTISYEGDDITALRGPLVDEAALHGILIKVRDLALPSKMSRRFCTKKGVLHHLIQRNMVLRLIPTPEAYNLSSRGASSWMELNLAPGNERPTE